MTGILAALYRENRLDDFDLDSLIGRLAPIRERSPDLRRVEDDRRGGMLFEGPDGMRIMVVVERGQLEFRCDQNAGGRCVRTHVSTTRDDDLLRRIADRGVGPWLDMMDGIMRSPRGEVHSRHKSSMSDHHGPGLEAFRTNQEIAEIAARIIAVHNPSHRPRMTVILRPPGAGHAGTVRDEKGRTLVGRTVEKALAALCAPVANVTRTNWTHSIEPVAHDVIPAAGHADPVELLRLMSRHSIGPFRGEILTKTGAGTE